MRCNKTKVHWKTCKHSVFKKNAIFMRHYFYKSNLFSFGHDIMTFWMYRQKTRAETIMNEALKRISLVEMSIIEHR